MKNYEDSSLNYLTLKKKIRKIICVTHYPIQPNQKISAFTQPNINYEF